MKLSKVFLTLVLTMLITTGVSVASGDIDIIIDGTELQTDVAPKIINNRTMVPMRSILESMGASVEWDGKTKTVTGTRGEDIIKLQLDNPKANINGKPITLDVPAKIVNQRTLVPVRFIAESLGATVGWFNNIVFINSDIHKIEDGMILIEGVIEHMTYEEVLKTQGYTDPNPGSALLEPYFTIFTPINPKEITLPSSGGDVYAQVPKMISLINFSEIKKYNGKTVTIGIDPNETSWPSDTSLPLGEPRSVKYKVIK